MNFYAIGLGLILTGLILRAEAPYYPGPENRASARSEVVGNSLNV